MRQPEEADDGHRQDSSVTRERVGGREYRVAERGRGGHHMQRRVGVEEGGGGEAGRHEQPSVHHASGIKAGVAADAVPGRAPVAHAAARAHQQARDDGARQAGGGFDYLQGVKDGIEQARGDEAADKREAPGREIALDDCAFETSRDPQDSPGGQQLTNGGDAEDSPSNRCVRGLEVEDYLGHLWCVCCVGVRAHWRVLEV
mmetsp:Transcript_13108/g.31782  ORF Transcript_13108/g.31782 Transcript_13108/m.31782 type:complete len:201 (+) Transcript_13108:1066-1668(+)